MKFFIFTFYIINAIVIIRDRIVCKIYIRKNLQTNSYYIYGHLKIKYFLEEQNVMILNPNNVIIPFK